MKRTMAAKPKRKAYKPKVSFERKVINATSRVESLVSRKCDNFVGVNGVALLYTDTAFPAQTDIDAIKTKLNSDNVEHLIQQKLLYGAWYSASRNSYERSCK